MLYFEPNAVKPGKYTFIIGTAGATTPRACTPSTFRSRFAATQPSEITITGGTHNQHAPCYHFLETTWAAYLARMGIAVELQMVRPGFYPRGGGEIRAVIHPCSRVKGLKLTTCPELTTAGGFSAFAGLPESVGKRQARRLVGAAEVGRASSRTSRSRSGKPRTPARSRPWSSGKLPIPPLFFGLGERGKPAESVADDAADEAIRFRDSGCPVDPHSADQLLLPLVFSPDASEYRTSEVTRHLTTNIATVGKFVNRAIKVDAEEGRTGTVRIERVV